MAFQYPNGTWILTKRRVLQSVSSVRRSMFPHRSCLPTCGQSGKTLVLFNMQSCFLIRFSFLIHWNYDFEKDVSYIKKILITNLPACRINFCILKKINSVVFVVSCVIRFVSAWWINFNANLCSQFGHNLQIHKVLWNRPLNEPYWPPLSRVVHWCLKLGHIAIRALACFEQETRSIKNKHLNLNKD